MYIALHTDDRFAKNKVVQIYIYVFFTKGLPSNDERSQLKWMTDRFAPPPLPLAKNQPALTFYCKHLFFQQQFIMKTDIF